MTTIVTNSMAWLRVRAHSTQKMASALLTVDSDPRVQELVQGRDSLSANLDRARATRIELLQRRDSIGDVGALVTLGRVRQDEVDSKRRELDADIATAAEEIARLETALSQIDVDARGVRFQVADEIRRRDTDAVREIRSAF